ncbi:MAG: hypothetical protein OXR73_07905 [Myxococcales bacterium]|nr:hypothetical protein [Myxococcales bacterium]
MKSTSTQQACAVADSLRYVGLATPLDEGTRGQVDDLVLGNAGIEGEIEVLERLGMLEVRRRRRVCSCLASRLSTSSLTTRKRRSSIGTSSSVGSTGILHVQFQYLLDAPRVPGAAPVRAVTDDSRDGQGPVTPAELGSTIPAELSADQLARAATQTWAQVFCYLVAVEPSRELDAELFVRRIGLSFSETRECQLPHHGCQSSGARKPLRWRLLGEEFEIACPRLWTGILHVGTIALARHRRSG